ncbi:MAG: hypothetical protein ACLGRW_06455 [Acidobacteriota bacterium]|jgi:hypothetical protein
MANGVLMLINLDPGNIAFLSLIASIVGVILGLVSAIAAISAAVYARRAARGDRAQAEQNAPRVERVSKKPPATNARVPEPKEGEALQAPAPHIAISVEGEAVGDVPVELLLTLQDSSVRVTRAERLSASGRGLGVSPCKATDNPLVFKCMIGQERMRQWRDAGESTEDERTRSILRVHLLLKEGMKEGHRDVPVSIAEDLRNVGIASLSVWNIKGSI